MAEFRMLEVECAFVDTLPQLYRIIEDYLKFVISAARNEWRGEIERLSKFLPNADSFLNTSKIDRINLDQHFPVVSYKEAVKIVENNGSKVVDGFDKKQERYLVDFHEGPLFIERFPSAQKPFYMRVNDQEESECFDFLVPGVGELIGGSVREYDVEKLRSRRLPQNMEWYLQLRETGYPRSSGFGLGFDRLMQFLFSIDNIKDTIPFPRWYKHCYC